MMLDNTQVWHSEFGYLTSKLRFRKNMSFTYLVLNSSSCTRVKHSNQYSSKTTLFTHGRSNQSTFIQTAVWRSMTLHAELTNRSQKVLRLTMIRRAKEIKHAQKVVQVISDEWHVQQH